MPRPAPPVRGGVWAVDPASAKVAFAGRVARFAPEFRARFAAVEGLVSVGAEIGVDIAIPLASMTTGNRTWDDLLTVLDPFEIDRFPIARFHSTNISLDGSGETAGETIGVRGALSLHGHVRELPLAVRLESTDEGALRLHASGTVDRQHHDIRCDIPGLARLVPQRMQLDIDVVARPSVV
jgi:polyisoprenoid-binding protein YceI